MHYLEESLLNWFSGFSTVLVAYSGGADSALVVAAAARALGTQAVTAATSVSDSLASGEERAARDLAESLGVRHVTVATDEMALEGYRANGRDRCYFCKSALLDALMRLRAAGAGEVVLTGTNADDVEDPFRPGIRAAAKRGARAPLAEAGLRKDDVRDISRAWGLATWNKPATPCLSSRIAYGVHVTPERLQRIDTAESGVRDLLARLGLPTCNLRVRDLGTGVRVEVDAEVVAPLRAAGGLTAQLRRAGFASAPCTVEAFASGSLNQGEADPAR